MPLLKAEPSLALALTGRPGLQRNLLGPCVEAPHSPLFVNPCCSAGVGINPCYRPQNGSEMATAQAPREKHAKGEGGAPNYKAHGS